MLALTERGRREATRGEIVQRLDGSAKAADHARRGFDQISSERAFNAGWKPRSLTETASDILEWYRTPGAKIWDWRDPQQMPWRDPLTPEKEQAVLNHGSEPLHELRGSILFPAIAGR